MAVASLVKTNTLPDKKKVRNTKTKITPDDMKIVNTLGELKKDLDFLHKNLDYVTDSMLIDSYVYEIKAVHMKYQYYLRLCKERGIVGDGIV